MLCTYTFIFFSFSTSFSFSLSFVNSLHTSFTLSFYLIHTHTYACTYSSLFSCSQWHTHTQRTHIWTRACACHKETRTHWGRDICLFLITHAGTRTHAHTYSLSRFPPSFLFLSLSLARLLFLSLDCRSVNVRTVYTTRDRLLAARWRLIVGTRHS